MDRLIIIKTSDFEANLAIAKSYLIDNGVDCIVNSGYISISQPESGSATLQVRSEDYARAKELLIEGGFSKEEDFI